MPLCRADPLRTALEQSGASALLKLALLGERIRFLLAAGQYPLCGALLKLLRGLLRPEANLLLRVEFAQRLGIPLVFQSGDNRRLCKRFLAGRNALCYAFAVAAERALRYRIALNTGTLLGILIIELVLRRVYD